MAITVKDKIFNLETENTLYQMKVEIGRASCRERV